jgi:hypothetical protein
VLAATDRGAAAHLHRLSNHREKPPLIRDHLKLIWGTPLMPCLPNTSSCSARRPNNDQHPRPAHLQPAPFATTAVERPAASPWARYQQKQGPGGITTLRHQTLHIQDPFGQWLLGQLDGTRTSAEIAHALASTVKPDAQGHLDFDKELLEAQPLVQEGLQKFLQLGLLVANP